MTSFARHSRFSLTLLLAFCWLAAGTSALLRAEESLTPEELALVKQAQAARTRMIQQVYGTVVAIYGNDRQGGGSGFLFDSAGYALTNHHVVAAAGSEGWAGLADGRLYRWQLIGTDPGGDVAIIRLAGQESFPVAQLGLSDTVRVGDWIVALGNPFVLAEDQTPTATLGIVSGIGRYQAGAGKNTLVYGNCIQIDSSVNPGNSGGPSFDMTGRVIGINGRISAMERGRVNVGVGYAISMEQIRNFIPDLLATKVVQHGTLDAQFSTRRGEVICSALNIDSPIARAGIKLGDRLISFQGTPIDDVNVFTNLVTLYPAGWPVEVVFDRGGKVQTAYVRLIPLPYDIKAANEAPQEEEPEEQPGEKEKPAEEPGDKEEEAKRRQPGQGDKPRVVQAPRGLQLNSQGVVRDAALNKAVTDLLLARVKEATWQHQLPAAEELKGYSLEIVDELLQDGKPIGTQRLQLSPDGFHLKWDAKLGTEEVAFDGTDFYTIIWPKGDEAEKTATKAKLDAAEALAKPLVLAAYSLAKLIAEQPLAGAEVQLTGGDAARHQRAYRLAATQRDLTLYLWLSMADAQGDPQIRLLKAGLDTEAGPQKPAIIYDNWQASDVGLLIPRRRAIVTGLEEAVQMEIITQRVARLDQINDRTREEKP